MLRSSQKHSNSPLSTFSLISLLLNSSFTPPLCLTNALLSASLDLCGDSSSNFHSPAVHGQLHSLEEQSGEHAGSPRTSQTVLSTTEDVQLRTILTSKLEPSIHANVITHDNEKSSKKIWKSISDYFASSQASNRARIFNAVLHVQFNPNNVLEFITQIKTAISRLHEVGINLPKDIIAYLILHKLPPSMTNISQQITHSDKEITAELVLDHLRLYANDQQILSLTGSSNKQTPVSLLTNEERKCRRGWHNPNALHSKSNCWFLYPHLRPSSEDKKMEASTQPKKAS
ncbi:hypothetical protein VP01_2543g1 [Puccinia sorghi]|uniref:Uncharacterized protein n=1 Tax=Puccinia sorghi TaxID=27349 RepID=A0A0L6V557_9BASI|nr:hypothetical protein VP01_2543g1 [Puccinia sorghi]